MGVRIPPSAPLEHQRTTLAGYFVGEIVHYRVFRTGHLKRDAEEWVRQTPVILLTFLLAAGAAVLVAGT